MTWSVILITFKEGINYFRESSKNFKQKWAGVHFLGGPNISLQNTCIQSCSAYPLKLGSFNNQLIGGE